MANEKRTKICRYCKDNFDPEWTGESVFCHYKCSVSYKNASIEERFWLNVDKRSPTECWPWLGHLTEKGYGDFNLNGKAYRASRYSLELQLGRQLREGYFALHTCDYKACCNPAHLYEGTAKQNIHDKMERGLQIQKLDEEKVRLIRSLRGKKTQGQIAKELGVSIPLVCRVQLGIIWNHIE